MTATWTTQISESKWRRVRRELEDNGLVIPFTAGVAQNRKTGYTMTNRYDPDTSRLEIKITYPGGFTPYDTTRAMLNNLFDCRGMLWPDGI